MPEVGSENQQAELRLLSCQAETSREHAAARVQISVVDTAALEEVPIEMDFGLVRVEVSVKGSDPLPVLLNTGFE